MFTRIGKMEESRWIHDRGIEVKLITLLRLSLCIRIVGCDIGTITLMKSLSRIGRRKKVPRRSYFRATDVFPYSDIVWVRLFRFRSFLCIINAEPKKSSLYDVPYPTWSSHTDYMKKEKKMKKNLAITDMATSREKKCTIQIVYY